MQLPVVKNLIATIQRLESGARDTELKAEKAVADRVIQTKLNLSPQVIDIMKSQAAQELAQEQRDKDDDVLGF